MKVKFIHTLLVATAFVAASGSFVSCKDYESDDVQEIKNLTADQYKSFNDQLTALQTKVDNLKTCNCETEFTKLSGDINDLRTALNAKGDTTYVKQGIASVKAELVNTLASLITNVEVQGTYTPAFGSLSLPLDIQSNLLVTYYGENGNGSFSFPTNDSQYLSGDGNAEISATDLRGADKVTIPAGTLLDKDGATGNAGTLYVTVNPQEVDLTDVPFSLVNSKGDKSSATLSGASDYNDVLTWGYTRAGSNVKAIKATITKEALDNSDIKINIKASGLTAAIKEAVNEHSAENLKNLAKKSAKFIYDNINTTIPRLGIATEYSVGSGADAKTLHNVGSLDILAAAVKPAGFNLLDNVELKSVPGLERAESIINNYFKNLGADLAKVGTIKLDEDGKYYVGYGDDRLNVTSLINQLDITSENIDKVNDLIADMQGKVNGGSITSYLENANTRLTYWFNRAAGAALKPVLLIDGGHDAHRVTAAGITVNAGSYTLVPTTWTYELLAPAYKKFVKVYSGSDVAYNNVIDGDVREVPVTLAAGKTYTVVYEAVDYTGNVVAKKYTINVK